jgi:hypothetical protein
MGLPRGWLNITGKPESPNWGKKNDETRCSAGEGAAGLSMTNVEGMLK